MKKNVKVNFLNPYFRIPLLILSFSYFIFIFGSAVYTWYSSKKVVPMSPPPVVDNMEVTISSVKKLGSSIIDPINKKTITTNGEYILVDMNIKNVGTRKYQSLDEFELRDAQGRIFDPLDSYNSSAILRYTGLDKVNDFYLNLAKTEPGDSSHFINIFEVPKDSMGLKLRVSGFKDYGFFTLNYHFDNQINIDLGLDSQ